MQFRDSFQTAKPSSRGIVESQSEGLPWKRCRLAQQCFRSLSMLACTHKQPQWLCPIASFGSQLKLPLPAMCLALYSAVCSRLNPIMLLTCSTGITKCQVNVLVLHFQIFLPLERAWLDFETELKVLHPIQLESYTILLKCVLKCKWRVCLISVVLVYACLVVLGESLKRGTFCSALSVYGKAHVAHFQEF